MSIGGRYYLFADWMRRVRGYKFDSLPALESAVLEDVLSLKPGKHAVAKLAGLIGRSAPTLRRRLRVLVDKGLEITANFIELASVSRSDALEAMAQNAAGGVYWSIIFEFGGEFRHHRLGRGLFWRSPDGTCAFDRLVAGGWKAILQCRTVNSYHFAGA